jgi:hypothetical protein
VSCTNKNLATLARNSAKVQQIQLIEPLTAKLACSPAITYLLPKVFTLSQNSGAFKHSKTWSILPTQNLQAFRSLK